MLKNFIGILAKQQPFYIRLTSHKGFEITLIFIYIGKDVNSEETFS